MEERYLKRRPNIKNGTWSQVQDPSEANNRLSSRTELKIKRKEETHENKFKARVFTSENLQESEGDCNAV